MKNKFLITGLILQVFAFCFVNSVSANELPAVKMYNQNQNGEILVLAKTAKSPNFITPPVYKNNGRFWNFRRKYGTLTGFTPPAGQTGYWNNYLNNNRYTGFYPNSGINLNGFNKNSYWNNGWQNQPLANNSISSKLKRFFNPNYNNHYLNSPGYNPYLNGNYNNLQNNRYIPFYQGNNGINGFQNGTGINLDTNTNSTGGATVTIID